MSQRKNRERLFKSSTPTIRLATDADMGWLWAAHKVGGGEMPQEQFVDVIAQAFSAYSHVWMLEDKHSRFKSGHGPIGVVAALFNGWKLEPHVEWFPWASPRNKLRSTVAYLNTFKEAQTEGKSVFPVGCVEVRTQKENKDFFYKMGPGKRHNRVGCKNYLSINYVGRIFAGRPTTDEDIFSVRGKMKWAA